MLTVAKFERYDMINNVGEETPAMTVWFSGCNFRCKGCHNPSLWNKRNGQELSPTSVAKTIMSQCRLYDFKTVVFIGGEPLHQNLDDIEALCRYLSEEGLKIFLYTGYTFDEIPAEVKKYVNTIKCGAYDENLKQDGFPASSNQYVMVKENNKWKRKDN